MPLRSQVLTYSIISTTQNGIISTTFSTKSTGFYLHLTSTIRSPTHWLSSFLFYCPAPVCFLKYFFLLFIILHSFQTEVCKMLVIFYGTVCISIHSQQKNITFYNSGLQKLPYFSTCEIFTRKTHQSWLISALLTQSTLEDKAEEEVYGQIVAWGRRKQLFLK